MFERWFWFLYAMAVAVIITMAIDSKRHSDEQYIAKRQIEATERAEKIVRVKRQCDLTNSEISNRHVKFTYVCPNDDVFTYTEKFNEK